MRGTYHVLVWRGPRQNAMSYGIDRGRLVVWTEPGSWSKVKRGTKIRRALSTTAAGVGFALLLATGAGAVETGGAASIAAPLLIAPFLLARLWALLLWPIRRALR
jgi:hypothetical protein